MSGMKRRIRSGKHSLNDRQRAIEPCRFEKPSSGSVDHFDSVEIADIDLFGANADHWAIFLMEKMDVVWLLSSKPVEYGDYSRPFRDFRTGDMGYGAPDPVI